MSGVAETGFAVNGHLAVTSTPIGVVGGAGWVRQVLTAHDSRVRVADDELGRGLVLVSIPDGWRATDPRWAAVRRALRDHGAVYCGDPGCNDAFWRHLQITGVVM